MPISFTIRITIMILIFKNLDNIQLTTANFRHIEDIHMYHQEYSCMYDNVLIGVPNCCIQFIKIKPIKYYGYDQNGDESLMTGV